MTLRSRSSPAIAGEGEYVEKISPQRRSRVARAQMLCRCRRRRLIDAAWTGCRLRLGPDVRTFGNRHSDRPDRTVASRPERPGGRHCLCRSARCGTGRPCREALTGSAHQVKGHASDLVALFKSIRISWVPREMNAEADRLVKDALSALD